MSKTLLPSIGVLIRRVPVRVRDISTAGCLLETPDTLPEGSIGLLELDVNGERHTETLRVCRSARISGGAQPWRAGAHFLALNAPRPSSVRNVVARFEILDELGSMPESMARVYRRGSVSAGERRQAWLTTSDAGEGGGGSATLQPTTDL